MSGEITFMRRMVKYTWHGCKTDKYILSELEFNPFVKKIQNYRNRCIQHTGQTDRLPQLIM
jgi:hypothetical protein